MYPVVMIITFCLLLVPLQYKKLKAERVQVLMDAVEKIFPGLDDRLEVSMIGKATVTPSARLRYIP